MHTWHLMKFRVSVIVLSLLLALVPSSLVYAQVAGATLSGTITDPSGAALVKVEVSIKHSATGVTRTVTSDSAGFYTAPNLVPGDYQVTVAARGFSTSVADVTLTIASNQTLDVGRGGHRKDCGHYGSASGATCLLGPQCRGERNHGS